MIVAEVGEVDDPDLRATIGPATFVCQAAICGQPVDAEAMATQLTALMFAGPASR